MRWHFVLLLVVVSIGVDLAVWSDWSKLTRADYAVFAVVRYALPLTLAALIMAVTRAIGRRFKHSRR